MVVAAGAATALLTSPAGAAQEAASTSDLTAAACHTPEPPTMSGGFVHGRGSGSCPQRVSVYIQRFGWTWEVKGSNSYQGPGSAVASTNCQGSGHYTYRTLVQWRDGTGPKSEYSEERRFFC